MINDNFVAPINPIVTLDPTMIECIKNPVYYKKYKNFYNNKLEKIYFEELNDYKEFSLFGILMSVKYDKHHFIDGPAAYVLTFKNLIDTLNGKRKKLILNTVDSVNLLKFQGFLDKETNEILCRLIQIAGNGAPLSNIIEYEINGSIQKYIKINTYIKESSDADYNE